MTEQAILAALRVEEDEDWEFKDARGGLPGSLWETYSAMANTDGGVIVMGVAERDGVFELVGLPDPSRARKEFWDTVNNRGKVSANLLSNDQVRAPTIGGKTLVVVRVPRAARTQRPVYVGQNPLEGTYRRNYEGDYKCRREEVGRMLADQSEEGHDTRVLEHFRVDDLDEASIAQYRNRFASRDPDHPWLREDDAGFLRKLGAWRTERGTEVDGLTVAGLLMFGTNEALKDPAGVPQLNLDYREHLSDDPSVRWTDRLTYDGTWVCNVYQFSERVTQRLTADLKVPFQLDPQRSLFRRDDTVVHEAVREALVNALVHCDYRGQGGVVILKHRDRFEFSNPGTLLLSMEQIRAGGVSECRNKTLQTMFGLLGYGEKAGSGFDKIRQGWASQRWRAPHIAETAQPDRVKLTMPMVSLLPDDAVARVRALVGGPYGRLSPLEVQALVTADVEHGVSNRRMQLLCEEHPSDITRLLQGLVSRGLLVQVGKKRGASYRLPGSSQNAGESVHRPGDSIHKPGDSIHKRGDSIRKPAVRTLADLPEEERQELRLRAEPESGRRRLSPDQMQRALARLCTGRYLTAEMLGALLGRNVVGLRGRHLSRLVERGALSRLYADEPNRPDQAYTTTAKGLEWLREHGERGDE